MTLARRLTGELLGTALLPGRRRRFRNYGRAFNAKESCPIFPGHANRLHRNFENPAVAGGSEDERLAVFRR